MNYSHTLVSLSQHELQQVVGGSSSIVKVPGCILYVPGYPGATTSPIDPADLPY